MKKLPRSLWWLRPNTFQSDNESAVVLVSRKRHRYREGDRSLLVDQELGANPHEVAIDRESMRSWEPPHDGDALDEADKDRIIENMRRALATRRHRLDLF